MSDAIVKGAKRPSNRPASQKVSTKPSAKGRGSVTSSARPKQIVKRTSAEKAPVRKAVPSKSAVVKNQAASKTARPAKQGKAKPASATKSSSAKTRVPATTSRKPKVESRPTIRKIAKGSPAKKESAPVVAKNQQRTTPAKPSGLSRSSAVVASAPRQPTRDEAAALRAFERAHREFSRGRFSESRLLFRALIEQHGGAAEVTARARTYLAIAEARLQSESAPPRDAEALYDRGVIELNRGDYVAAQEMFERALKRDPEAADVHYALAATRARLGSVDSALQSLARALSLKHSLRVRAQHDPDLVSLRSEPDYERLIFAARP